MRARCTGSPSAIFFEEIVTSGVPLPTLIPSVTFPRKDTTPATVATATDSSPWAASTCPLVLITCWKGAGSITLTLTPAASAFAFGRMISSLCASADSLCPSAASWLCSPLHSPSWEWSEPSASWLCPSVAWSCSLCVCVTVLLLQEPSTNKPRIPTKISFFIMIFSY